MPKRTPENRASSCSFTSAHGRQCTMPRAEESEFCFHHSRKLRYSREAELAALEIFEPISGSVVTSTALAQSLARLFARVADGRISPKQALAMTRVADSLRRTISSSKAEYRECFRPSYVTQILRSSFGELPRFEPPVFPNRTVVPALPEQTKTPPALPVPAKSKPS